MDIHNISHRVKYRDFPGNTDVRTPSMLPMQGGQVQFLAGELRSHTPHVLGVGMLRSLKTKKSLETIQD